MSQIRIVRLAVTNVGPLLGRVDLGALDPQLTLVAGENEIGKSTLVAALRAALFERHNAGHRGIKSLQPHSSRLAPEVEVTVAVGDEEISIHKRFIEKPSAEVRIGGAVYAGEKADDILFNRLGAQPPGKQGAKPADMGVWGLLWVNQDDSAFTDPGERLDGAVRGALQEAIGRQVGQVLGGRHGERLRDAVRARLLEFYTEKQEQPTGAWREASDKVALLRDRITQIEAAMASVRSEADRRGKVEAELEALARTRPELVDEERQARADAEAAVAAQTRFGEADGQRSVAEAKMAEIDARRRERGELKTRAEEDAGEAGRLEERLREMGQSLATRVDEDRDASRELADEDAALIDARNKLDSATKALDHARRTAETRRRQEVLARVDALAVRRETITTILLDAVDTATWRMLRDRNDKVNSCHERIVERGTQLRVNGPGVDFSAAIAREQRLDVVGVGSLRVVPSQPGLRQAVAASRENATALRELLLACGAATLEEARSLRRQRLEAEVSATGLQRELDSAAPNGIPSLQEEVRSGRDRVEALKKLLARAREISGRCTELQSRLDSESVRDAEADHIGALAHDVDLAAARRAAIGTSVRVQSLASVVVSLDDGPSDSLERGAERAWTLTRPALLDIGGLVRVHIEPGGEDQREAGASWESARDALAQALLRAGVESAEVARRRALVARELAVELATERGHFADAAPRGLDAVAAELLEAESTHRLVSAALEVALGHANRLGEASAVLAANSVTRERAERLEVFAAEAERTQASAQSLSARVEVDDVTSEWAGPRAWHFSEHGTEEMWGGMSLEVVPGDIGEEAAAALEAAERILAAELGRAGVADIAAAEERWKEGMQLNEQIREIDQQVVGLAPCGVDALRADVGTLPIEEPGADLATLEAECKTLREASAAIEERRDRARDRAAMTREAHTTFEEAVRQTRSNQGDLVRRAREALVRLEAARMVCSDADLDDSYAEASERLAHARDAATRARVALQSLAPDLVGDEVRRSAQAVASLDRRVTELRMELTRLDTLLATAAVAGHFEELEDRRADLGVWQDRLTVLDREARAVKRLATEVDHAYEDAQRRFLAPVVEQAGPYLNLLRPGTNLQMTPDLKVDRVVRAGIAEEFSTLSGGTREQLSVIVRLALARVLARDRRPLPLILDDTMGWTDDGRFISMVRILRDASKELQILVLTCQPSRWEARLGAPRTIHLDQLRRATEV